MQLNFKEDFVPLHEYIMMVEDGYMEVEVERETNRIRTDLRRLIERENLVHNSDVNVITTVWDNETRERYIAGINSISSVHQEIQKVYKIHDDILLRILGEAYRYKLIYSHKSKRVSVRVKVLSIYNILNENTYMCYPKEIMLILIDYILRGLIRHEIK